MFWDKHPVHIRSIEESLWTALLANHPAAANRAGTDTQGSASHASFPQTTRGLQGIQNTLLLAARSHWRCLLTCVNTQLQESSFHPQRLYNCCHACSSLSAVSSLHLHICCSASLSSVWCQRGSCRKPFLLLITCMLLPWVVAGSGGLEDYRALGDFSKALAPERCSTLTAKCDLFCRENLPSPSSFPPPQLTGSQD